MPGEPPTPSGSVAVGPRATDTAASEPAGGPPPALTELLIDALKAAVKGGGEQRLFRAGKLPGLFPSRAGPSAEAATYALRQGLLETTRTEVRGKVVVEWVRVTPSGVHFVYDHDSPKSLLREMNELLGAASGGIPAWLAETRSEFQALASRFEQHAHGLMSRLDDLKARVEAALRRAEAAIPTVADPVKHHTPWAITALEYLDRRAVGGGSPDCPLPELFHAIRLHFPDLTVADFHNGLRRLHDLRSLRLIPGSGPIAEPEYAVVLDGLLMSAVRR